MMFRKLLKFAVVASSIVGLAAISSACPLAKPDSVVVTPTADVPCGISSDPLPAFNIGVLGGEQGSDTFGGLSGDVFLPLSNHIGLQFDGDLGLRAGSGFYGQAAAHGFIFDTQAGSLGVYGSWASYGLGSDVSRLGAEINLNSDNLFLTAVGGWQSVGSGNVFLDSRFGLNLGSASRAYLGYAYDNGGIGKIGFEHDLQLSLASSITKPTLSFEVSDTSTGTLSAKAGLKFSFGGQPPSNCPTPAPKFSITHWDIARKPDSVRKCTLADAAKNMGLILDATGTDQNGETWRLVYPPANVVNGDISTCRARIEN